MKKLTRRGWNNVLILGIIAFMVILNFPTIIKNHFLEPEQSTYPYVLNPLADIREMHFARLSISREDGDWLATQDLSISPLELVQRWHSLAGTEVSETTYLQIKNQLPEGATLEVWYLDQEEPQRVTYYQTAHYWLMRSWEQKWVAVSVDEAYLFPVE